MYKLENYIAGKWITGDGDGQQLYNAVTGEVVAAATTKGLDFKSMTEYARKVGNRHLRKMTFHERGRYAESACTSFTKTPRKILYHSVIKQAQPKQIAGWILKGVLEIFLPMHLCEENFRMKLFVSMAKVIT